MEDNNDHPILPHVYTEEEIRTFEAIIALLQNGGRIIEGNQYFHHPRKGGLYRLTIEQNGQMFVFESKVCAPWLFGPKPVPES